MKPQTFDEECEELRDRLLLSSRKSAKNLTFRWDHTTKPSLFEVWENGILIHSGPYNQAPAIKP